MVNSLLFAAEMPGGFGSLVMLILAILYLVQIGGRDFISASLFGLALSAAAIYFFSLNLSDWYSEHNITALTMVLGYFVGAAVWMTFQWKLFCTRSRRDYDEYLANWLVEKKVKDGKLTDELKAEWFENLNLRMRGMPSPVNPPDPYKHNQIGNLAFSFFHWPLDMVFQAVINSADFFEAIFDGVMSVFSAFFRHLGRQSFRSATKDLPTKGGESS
jgi:hypothetical protein